MILKPILDRAMIELIYEDDKQITGLLRNPQDGIRHANLEGGNSETVLSEALAGWNTPFVHVIVDHVVGPEVTRLTEDIAILVRKFIDKKAAEYSSRCL